MPARAWGAGDKSFIYRKTKNCFLEVENVKSESLVLEQRESGAADIPRMRPASRAAHIPPASVTEQRSCYAPRWGTPPT